MFRYFFFSLLSLFAFEAVSAATPMACTMEYAPVCATKVVQCIQAPCDPIKETYSNSCMARAAGATVVSTGACEVVSEPKMCPMNYLPVCGTKNGQKVTYSNSCMAGNAGATAVTEGECGATPKPPIVGGDRDSHGCIPSAGYVWNPTLNQCARSWELPKKMSPKQALQVAEWKLKTYNESTVASGSTLNFSKKGTFSLKVCNTMNGRYQTNGSNLIFRNVTSTMMYCEGAMQLEWFFHQPRLKFSVGSDFLSISDKKGNITTWTH